MNEIQLDEKIKLTSDEYCWRLERKGRRKDKDTGEWVETWKPFKYYTSPPQALKGYAAMTLRQAGERSLDGLVEAHHALIERIEGLLPAGMNWKD